MTFFQKSGKNFLFFKKNETYNLRSGNYLVRKNNERRQFGIKSVLGLGAKLWDLLHGKIENSFSLYVFKNKIRKWIP